MTTKVRNTAELRQALAAGLAHDQIEVCNAEAIAAARAEGVIEGKAAAPAKPDQPSAEALRAEGAKTERTRIAGLREIARAGFEAEHTAAIEAGDSPAQFALTMMKAAKDRGITLDAIAKDSPPAAPHAKPTDKPTPKAGDAKSWDDIAAAASTNTRM